MSEQEVRHDKERGTRTITAVVLICVGLAFLLNQFNVLNLEGNWWAFFIFIPAGGMLYAAYRGYEREQRVTEEVGRNLSGGVIVGGIAIMALFSAWDWLLPFIFIVIGVFMLLGWVRSDSKEKREA